MVTITKHGRVVARSRNLAAINRYLPKGRGAAYVELRRRRLSPGEWPREGDGELYIRFVDGAECTTTFASFEVMKDWVYRKGGRAGWIPREVVHVRGEQLALPGVRDRRASRDPGGSAPEVLSVNRTYPGGIKCLVKVYTSKVKRGYDLVDVILHDNGATSTKSANRLTTTSTHAIRAARTAVQSGRDRRRRSVTVRVRGASVVVPRHDRRRRSRRARRRGRR